MILGKNHIHSITRKVDLYEPTSTGAHKKAGTIKVTVKVLNRSDLQELVNNNDDKEIVRALVLDIQAGDSTTQVPEYTPDLIDDIFEVDWQFTPILEAVLMANSERLGRVLKQKN